MSYEPDNSPPSVKSGAPLGVVIGLCMAGGLFLLLPLMQLLEQSINRERSTIEVVEVPPPPPPPPDIEPPKREEEEQEVEELEESTPPPTLEQLELSLSADLSGVIGGDFTLPTIAAADEVKELIFSISDLDEVPRPTFSPAPKLPTNLTRQGVRGQVQAKMIVNEQGNVIRVEIVSSDDNRMNDSVKKQLGRWRFTPGVVNGSPVKFQVILPIDFN